MTFAVEALQFEFRAVDRVVFPPGKAGNVVRGAFGLALLDVAGEDAYERLFAPEAAKGPSGLGDPPRPFVFRAQQLDGRTVVPGDLLRLDVHLFYPLPEWVEWFERALVKAMVSGIGPGRGRAELADIARRRVEIPLAPETTSHLLVRFLTPTEIKEGGHILGRPDFPALFSRARDRVSTLRSLYGPGPLEIDFRAMAERSHAVRMTRCDVQHAAVERRSSRTGQTHPLGGFTGEAEYEGDPGEFVPFLRAAQWTGIGRQTVWGKGAIEIQAR